MATNPIGFARHFLSSSRTRGQTDAKPVVASAPMGHQPRFERASKLAR